ncbi:MAG: uracil-DNA glycosylase [Deltaproteobacteria bacterium]|nr:uracil-DNA glycosylase [Deltaproteobacteria bacterium]
MMGLREVPRTHFKIPSTNTGPAACGSGPPVHGAPRNSPASPVSIINFKMSARQLSPSEKKSTLEQLYKTEVEGCQKCRLCTGRTNIVFGVGNPDAKLMFVGEAPGRDEDAQGEPFVGRAGQLLNKIIEAMGFKRSDVYIGNIAKCRPPDNRQPAADEMAACMPYLRKQIDIIDPKIIVCLGATAIQGLLQTEEKISRIRGTFRDWDGIKVMPTFHPAYLLRNPEMKKTVWEDMKKVMEELKK